MKKTYLTLMIGFFIAFCGKNLFADESEAKLPIPMEIIEEKISEYLSTHFLYPYVRPGQNAFTVGSIVKPIIDNDRVTTIFVEAVLENEEKPINGLFGVRLFKITNTAEAKLFCLSDSDLISPTLLFDIASGPQMGVSCPEGIKLLQQRDGHIFISSDDSNIDVERIQTWTFFTPNESYDVPVKLTNDGKGGAFFNISIPKD